MSATMMDTVSARRAEVSMPLGRLFEAYAAEVRYESLRMLRTPGMAIPFLVLPAPIYLFFGVVLAGPAIAEKPQLANYLFSSWMAFAVMGPALFGPGCALAVEREAGLMKLKRAQPSPGGAWLVAKTVMAMVFAALALTTVVMAAVAAGTISLTGGQLLTIGAVMVGGVMPFCAIGLSVGTFVSGSTAPAILNAIFLPMLWLSGLFIPLPKYLEPWVVVWPAFHLNQLAIGAAGVEGYSFIAPQVAAAVLLGITVLCGGLAIRRLARRG